jgi:pimeloyl-ACP methyl ester carboxylesterase
VAAVVMPSSRYDKPDPIDWRLETMDRQRVPFVFIPGDFGDGQDAWAEVVRQIVPSRQTLVADRPGNEALPSPEKRHTFASDAAAVLVQIGRLGAEQVHLVGHSYGGLVAIEVAATRPDLIRSLHLIEPPMFAVVPEKEAAQAMNREARRIQAERERMGDEASTEAFFAMIDMARAVARLRDTPEWGRFTTYAARFAGSEPAGDFPVSTLERLPGDVPIALYTGGRSHPALREITAALAKRLPRARVIDIAGANHAVQRAGAPFVSRLLSIADAADAAVNGRRRPGSERAAAGVREAEVKPRTPSRSPESASTPPAPRPESRRRR